MPLLPPDAVGQSFSDLNYLISECPGLGKQFRLVKDLASANMAAAEVFTLTEGVYILHCYYFHPEDAGIKYAEPIHHYIVYNAGTRVLFLYPEVSYSRHKLDSMLFAHTATVHVSASHRLSCSKTRT